MPILTKVLSVILTILIGSGGVIALFYSANLLIEWVAPKWRNRIFLWIYLGPALAVLTAYLELPTFNTIYTSLFDKRSRASILVVLVLLNPKANPTKILS